MKKFFFLMLLLNCGISYCQEGVTVKGNTITTRQVAPVWPGCEDSPDSNACFTTKMTEHLKANYKYPRDADGNIIRGKAVVAFNINKEGNVEILHVKGEHELLNEEAKRIIMAIPKMKPGELAGEPIAVKYTIPFNF